MSMVGHSSLLPIGFPAVIAFWAYLIPNILSLICSLFVLYYLIFNRTLRHSLNNHIIIILLFMGIIYELTTVPWILYRRRYGTPWLQIPTFYLCSFFFDYGIYSTQIALFAWATIERHILIFHDQWVSTKKKRFFIHYLPIMAIIMYCFIYYTLVVFAPFCQDSFQSFLAINFYIPCVFVTTLLGKWDLLVHQVIPTLIIVIFSITLIFRVLRQKRMLNQPIRWRKHRKMTIQLLSISVLYMVFNSPWTLISFGGQFGVSQNVLTIPLVDVNFLRVYLMFLFPFVCCASLPELPNKFKKKFLCCRRRNRIAAGESIEMGRTVT